jgi:leucyl/phenylalanyl-tRNA--protein transferase
MVFQLDNRIWFPDPYLADPDGLLAIGGDLCIDRLLLAYSHGIFPWYPYEEEEPMWFCPHERFVIFPNEIHISHSMRTLKNKGIYHVTFNEDFEGVINYCSQLRIEEAGAWLGPDMVEAYIDLHDEGYAFSVETRDQEE